MRRGLQAAFVSGIAALLLAQHSLADDFQFVVIGDTRPRFEREDFRNFEALIPKINDLHPAFVINLGDLIYGYGLRKETQWDKYEAVAKKLTPPYYQVPGNHDTFSKSARRVYGRRFGQFYQSFNYAGCHFVLLDTCEESRWGFIGPRQARWLEADLQANTLRPVFVFLHFPLWEPDRIKPEYHAFWRQTLHPLFRRSGVAAVFGGHYHCYGPTLEMDGIRYFITGGGGAELLPDYRNSGGQYHFMRVAVTNGAFEPFVVTSKGEIGDVEADLMGGLRFADRHSSRIGVPATSLAVGDSFAFSVTVENPYPQRLRGSASWRLDPTAFAVAPTSVDISVPFGGEQALSFEAKVLKVSPSLQSLPWLDFDLQAGSKHHRFKRELLLVVPWKAPFTPAPVAVDGSLSEWSQGSSIQLEGGGSVAEFHALHDRRTLYLAASLPVASGGEAEEGQEPFADDFVLGIAPWLNEHEFGGDHLRLGFRRTGRFTDVRDRTPGHRPSMPLSVQAASRVQDDHTLFEAAIPLKVLTQGKGAGKTRFVLSFSFRSGDGGKDVEGAGPATNRNSFSYQVRYGGAALVPVYYTDLELLERGPRK